MASYDHELLSVAARLLRRRVGQRGKLSSAQVRRGVSTIFYAMFHFLVDEAARSPSGTTANLTSLTPRMARTWTGATTNGDFEARFDWFGMAVQTLIPKARIFTILRYGAGLPGPELELRRPES